VGESWFAAHQTPCLLQGEGEVFCKGIAGRDLLRLDSCLRDPPPAPNYFLKYISHDSTMSLYIKATVFVNTIMYEKDTLIYCVYDTKPRRSDIKSFDSMMYVTGTAGTVKFVKNS
jgi:hypothetical protein